MLPVPLPSGAAQVVHSYVSICVDANGLKPDPAICDGPFHLALKRRKACTAALYVRQNHFVHPAFVVAGEHYQVDQPAQETYVAWMIRKSRK